MSCADHDDNFSFMLVVTTSIAGSDLTAPDGLEDVISSVLFVKYAKRFLGAKLGLGL